MMTDPILPLRQLLGPVPGDDPTWRDRAIEACVETIQRIERILGEADQRDRDTIAFLQAIRHSLEWVLNEQASTGEIARVVDRASRIFDRTALLIH
ncbi:MAG: hypothetical protein R3E87_21250 [Burkholderiaceae bacterium]